MGKNAIVFKLVITLFFLIALYFTEAGFCGSRVVARYNDGYGTLDMKSYDVQAVHRALAPMSEEGKIIYKQYYLMDFIFILFFGAFQIMLIDTVFSFRESVIATIFIFLAPILRGVCDIIENVVLLRTIYTYPTVNSLAIDVAAKFTQLKFACIRIWFFTILVGILWRVILLIKRLL